MSQADIRTEEVTYTGGGAEMKGYVAWDGNTDGQRPGILVVHEWWGQNDYPRRRARMLAELGYTAMALDLYGDGKIAADPDEAGALMNAVGENLDQGRERFNAALEVLKGHPTVNAEKTGAIGYCFGGGIVLHMARMGADLDVVASFHGALPMASAPGVEKMHTRVAAYHGEADSFFPPETITEFNNEMQNAGAHYYFIQLPGALHGFSNPMATVNGEKYGLPLAHNALADDASWAHMQMVFEDVFSD